MREINPGDRRVAATRDNPNNPSEQGPISGVDMLSIGRDTHITFFFPGMPDGTGKTLHIPHANSILWSYHLNTQVTPTYGGEVVQALSAFVGPITIKGQAHDRWIGSGKDKTFRSGNDELRRVYNWFRTYMTIAGGAGNSLVRNESAVHFTYPERGWDLYLQVTALRGFAIGTERLATEWQIEAEVVSDNDLDYFTAHTMTSFTDIPHIGENDTFGNPSFQDGPRVFIGNGDPRTDPEVSGNQQSSGASVANFAENFQRLVASYTSGDFAHWGFSQLVSPDENGLQDSKSYYDTHFGTDQFLPSNLTNNQSGGQISTGTFPPNSQNGIAEAIYNAFEAKGIPGRLGIAVALQESGMNPNRTQDACSSPKCGIGMFQVNGDGTGADSSLAVKKAGQGRVYESQTGNITTEYPASAQAEAAAGWFADTAKSTGTKTGTNWRGVNLKNASDEQLAGLAWDAQRAGDTSYVAHIERKLPDADALITQFSKAQGGSSGYKNPFRDYQNLGAGRVDEGVDFTGTGVIYAIGPAVVELVRTNTGWPGYGGKGTGGWVSYKLTSGKASGLTVYVSESIIPADGLKAGDVINAETVIGHVPYNKYPFIETGWAVGDGTDLAYSHTYYSEGLQTIHGKNFCDLLRSIGVSPIGSSDNPSGSLAPNWPQWV